MKPSNRKLKLSDEIRALPLPDKFRFVARLLDAGAVVPALTLSVARLALAELEARE